MGSVQQCSVLVCAFLCPFVVHRVGFRRPRPRGASRVVYCTWVRFGPVPGGRLLVWVILPVVASGAVSGSAGGLDGAGRGSCFSTFFGEVGLGLGWRLWGVVIASHARLGGVGCAFGWTMLLTGSRSGFRLLEPLGSMAVGAARGGWFLLARLGWDRGGGFWLGYRVN